MLVVNINWEYFLSAIGMLIALAYYANGRFTKLETSVEWMKDAIGALTPSRHARAKRERRSSALGRSKARPRSRERNSGDRFDD